MYFRILEKFKDKFYSMIIWHIVVSQLPGIHNKYDRKDFFERMTGYRNPTKYYKQEIKEVEA